MVYTDEVSSFPTRSRYAKENSTCFQKAGKDEPIFVLRGQDMMAPAVVRYWAYLANGGRPFVLPQIPATVPRKPKVDDAINCAKAMEAWPTRKSPD